MAKEINKDLRIMLVNEHGSILSSKLEKELYCKIDTERSARIAARCINPFGYNVVIIDASEDCIVDNIHSFSQFLKLKNPSIITIGTSVFGQYFKEDNLSNQLYDERIEGLAATFAEEVKGVLRKYGFKFQDEEVKKEK